MGGILIITTFVLILLSMKFLLNLRKKNVTGQVVLVTGGANGLGKELCLGFARLGCKIAVVDLDLENAEKTVKEILAEGVCTHARAYKV